MQVTISIKKEDVIKEVNKSSAYIGAKTINNDGTGNLYYNISTIKEDAEMLQRYWEEALSNVLSVAKPFVSDVEEQDTWSVTLTMPSNYNPAFDGVIKQKIFSYVVTYVLLNWLTLCNVATAVIQYYSTETASMLSGVDDILHARLFTRAAEGLETDNKFGGDEIETEGSEDDDDKTTDNTAGTDELPDDGETADDEKTTDNVAGIDEVPDTGDYEPEKTTDNVAGTDEMPELEEDDNTNTRGNTFGSDIRQNVTAVKAEIIKLY